MLTPPIVIGIVGVPVTVTASDGVTVKSKLTPTPDVPVPLGVVRLTLETVGAVVSIVPEKLQSAPATRRTGAPVCAGAVCHET